MLTDPFYSAAPKYSGSAQPIEPLTVGTSYVTAGLQVVGFLQAAGWTIVDSSPSFAQQKRPMFFMATALGIGTPVAMSVEQCKTWAGPSWYRGGAAGFTYNAYDPGAVMPICPAGTGLMQWYPAGPTPLETGEHWAEKLAELIYWNVSASDGGDGHIYFNFNSKADAFEYDEVPINIGSGDGTMQGGYYTLRSPSLGSDWVEIKVQTLPVNVFGAQFDYTFGFIRVVLTVTASGGGTFKTPLFPGTYNFQASGRQVLIWPIEGSTLALNQNASLLVSLIEPETGHTTAGNCPLVVASDNGAMTGNTDQIRKNLHWNVALACGFNGEMEDTGFRKGTRYDGYQICSMMVRGTMGRPTVSLNGQPLVEAPYLLIPPDPTVNGEPVIVGKVWDCVITSGMSARGARMRHDGRSWQCFGRSTFARDIGVDMWILAN